jgi:hypothetical protein
MSEPTGDTSPSEPADPPRIDFERAEFAEPSAEHVACGICRRAITTEYWQSLGKVLCEQCRDAVLRSAEDARRHATLGKAFLFGGGAALGCGIAYAVFVGLTHVQLALVTIGIGWVVGRAIQKVTRGFGAVRHQVLAAALTYFAGSMGYLPAIIKAIGDARPSTEQSAAAPSAAPAPPTTAPAVDPPPAPPAPPGAATAPVAENQGPGGTLVGLLGSLAVLTAMVTAFVLAAPLLDIANGWSGLLGALIIFFGLRTAWRAAKGVDAVVSGPHRVAAPAGP